uniref:Uncharacterized protein n=1 Tax=Glossina pallidipes TaxID=7398 RepID=A0A1A9ZTV2_GLOPL
MTVSLSFFRMHTSQQPVDCKNLCVMGNSLSVNQLQGALVDRLKSVSFTTDETTGNLRVRSFSDGGHLTARAATSIMREEHRNSLDVIHRPRYVRTSCTTIPEEDVVSA